METLTPERWKEISPYLDEALSLSMDQQGAWLNSLRAENPGIATLLEELLVSHRAAAKKHFLEQRPALPAEPSLAGQIIGAYKLISPLGQGGMGSVWRAERSDGRFERHVAVKFLRFSVSAQGGAARFKREGRILGQLAHPHIAELIDAGITPTGEPYLVLEYVEGKPIDEYCDQRRLDVDSRVRLFVDVISAVAHAHASLIVHRDLKPSNILVRSDGQVKLLDFGIAKLLADETSSGEPTLLTLEGGAGLTPQFAAPEQIMGAAVTTATDVYSLGVLLYLLMTGRNPAGASTHSAAELVKAIVDTEPVRASEAVLSSSVSSSVAELRSSVNDRLARQLRGDLDTIFSKALKKNPAERYGSASALAQDLQRYLRHEPISARPDSFAYRASKFVSRNRLGVTIGLLVFIAGAAAVVAVHREAKRAEYRFLQVQKLAHTVLFDLNPQIENLSGSTPARELLVKTSLEYLDSLAAEAGNDMHLRLELATAYDKIGDVQGNSRYSNLGHPEAALESYRKAVAIAEKLGNSPQALELLAAAYTGMGTIQATQLGEHASGRASLQRAIQLADSIPATNAKRTYKLRVEAYGLLGDIDELNDPTRAAAPIQRALQIATEWSRVDSGSEAKVYVAVLTKDWADIQWAMGDLNTARSLMLNSIQMFDELTHQAPDNAEWRTQEMVDWERMGVLSGHPDFFNLGDRKSAAEWFQKTIQQCERNLAADPQDVRARFELSESLGELAAVTRDSDPRRSEKLYNRSLALSTSALAADPQDFDLLYWQSFERVGFATLASKIRKQYLWREQLQRAISVLESLSTRDPNEVLAHRLLAVALQRRASYALNVGMFAGAEDDLSRSEAMLVKLSSENSANLNILHDLAECYRVKGDLAVHRSNWAEAQREYQQNLDLWQRWLRIGKSSVYDQHQRALATTLLSQADRHIQLPNLRPKKK
jgi:eukaryotic-like serine/threonine-protein kinase